MRRWDLINAFIKAYQYKSYLEIGLNKGKNFDRIECDLKDSVDPAEGRYARSNPRYKMNSDDFFEKVAPTLGYLYDLIFIDGLHISEQVDRDIHNSTRYLNTNGTIILHDCNPSDENHQKVPRIQTAWNGDVWKSAVRLRGSDCLYGCTVVDTDAGLGIIRQDINGKCGINVPKVLSWEWLEANRVEALGLITVEQLLTESGLLSSP